MRRRFGKTLEDKANELAAERGIRQWDTSIPAILRREITLTVEQLEQLKFLQRDQLRRLLQLECNINTEIMQYRQGIGIPWYMPVNIPDEQKLKQRLFEIEKERRNMAVRLHEKKHTLEDRLLSLINKHEQLDI